MKLVKSDSPILRQVCEPVLPGEALPFIEDMRSACRIGKGVGLAAPQIGILKRVIYLPCSDVTGTVKGQFMINPEIIEKSDETEVKEDGCLSFPGVFKRIRRNSWVKVRYLDKNRKVKSETVYGLRARVVQHECEHLEGVIKVGDPTFKGEPEAPKDLTSARGVLLMAACLGLSGMPAFRRLEER